jgi:hypothetical protein
MVEDVGWSGMRTYHQWFHSPNLLKLTHIHIHHVFTWGAQKFNWTKKKIDPFLLLCRLSYRSSGNETVAQINVSSRDKRIVSCSLSYRASVHCAEGCKPLCDITRLGKLRTRSSAITYHCVNVKPVGDFEFRKCRYDWFSPKLKGG